MTDVTALDGARTPERGANDWFERNRVLVALALLGGVMYDAPVGVAWTSLDLQRQLALGLVLAAIALGVALVGRWASLRVGFPDLPRRLGDAVRHAVLAVAVAVSLLLVYLATLLLGTGDLSLTGILRIAVWMGLDPHYTLGFLVASVGAAILEELIFRLLLMSVVTWIALRLTQRRGIAIATGLAVSSVVFAVGHGLAIPVVLLHLPAGLAFGLLLARRGIDAAIVAHIAFNIGGFVLATQIAPLFV